MLHDFTLNIIKVLLILSIKYEQVYRRKSDLYNNNYEGGNISGKGHKRDREKNEIVVKITECQ